MKKEQFTEKQLLEIFGERNVSRVPSKKCYILNDGRILEVRNCHQELARQIRQRGFSSGRSEQKFGTLGVPVVEEAGWIRVNFGREGYISLNEKEPTPEQYDTLTYYLDQMFTKSRTECFIRTNELYIYTAEAKETVKDAINTDFRVKYDCWESFTADLEHTDDIIKWIKKYYADKKLKEQNNI